MKILPTFKNWEWTPMFERRLLMSQSVHGRYVEEAGGMSRLYEHTKESNIGCISASRGENSKGENVKLTDQLRKDIREAGFGYVKIKGRFIENQGTDNEHAVDEEVALIVGDKTDEGKKKLKAFMEKMGAKYKQESILFKGHNDDEAILIDTVGENKGRETKIGKWHANKIGPYFSVMKGGATFVFTKEEEKKEEAPKPNVLQYAPKKKQPTHNDMDWWRGLSETEQKDYLKEHPNSGFKIAAKKED